MPVTARTIVDIREEIAVLSLSEHYTVTELAEMFGVSRPTVYKYRDRYRANGRAGLSDHRRAPKHPWRTDPALVKRIIQERTRWGWGSKKIRRRLMDDFPEISWPARSTFDEIFKNHGLTKARRPAIRVSSPFRRRYEATEPGELLTIDFKGQFRMRNGRYCYPLTVVDSVSRYLLGCKALESIELARTWPALERILRDHGLPRAVLSDNGPPFGGHGMSPLSTFSVRLMKLSIQPVFIDPAHPEQNGAHERMHRTLKEEATYPPAPHLRAQQHVFDRFRRIYNCERPHEALDLRRPSDIFRASPRSFPSRPTKITYPSSFEVRLVSANGSIKWRDEAVFLSHTLAGEYVGFNQTDVALWTVHFGDFIIGKFNEKERSFV